MTPTAHTHCACFTHNNLPCCNMGHAPDAPAQLIAEVQRLTQERDQARDIAVALEQQTAEALRISRGCFFPERDVRPSMLVNRASIVELLRVLETENQ